MRKFRHLNVPNHWEHYWTKYPEGYTILEALLNWVRQVDDMVDNVNDWNEYLDGFVERFDDELRGTVIEILREWQTDGTLDIVINEALQTEIDDVRDIAEYNRDSINTTHTNILYPPAPFSPAELGGDIYSVVSSIFNSLSTGGVVTVPPGVFYTSETIIIPDDVTLALSKGAILKPLGNIDVVRLRSRSGLSGQGMIDTGDINGFSRSAIYIDGVDEIGTVNVTTLADGVRLRGGQTGYGVHLHAKGVDDSITFCKTDNLSIMDFETAIRLEVNDPTGYVNGNLFSNTTVTRCYKGIELIGRTNQNQFPNFIYQTSTTITPERVIYCEGQRNYFTDITVFDWSYARDNNKAVLFTPGADANFMRITSRSGQIEDYGYANTIETMDSAHPHTRNIYAPPGTNREPSFVGDQDDLLAYADKRFTVTQTAGTMKQEELPKLFIPNMRQSVKWEETTPVSIEIDFGRYIAYWKLLGINFRRFNYAKRVVFYGYNTDGEWEVIHDVTDNSSSRVVAHLSSATSRQTFSRIRITFEGVNVGGEIIVERLFGYSTTEDIEPLTYIKPGDIVVDDLTFENEAHGIVLRDRSDGILRRVYLDNGTLNVEPR